MNDKILFVWDFHGVLEKGNVRSVQRFLNLVLKDFGINREISLEQTIDWYGVAWFDYFRLAAPEGNPELWQKMIDNLLSYRDRWQIVKENIEIREFAAEVLKTIQDRGHENVILTNARPEHARYFAELIGITGYLDDILGVDIPYNLRRTNGISNAKSEVLNNFLKGKNFAKIVVTGDNETDIQAGKACDAVTYLFSAPEIKKNVGNSASDHIISDLREVLKEIN